MDNVTSKVPFQSSTVFYDPMTMGTLKNHCKAFAVPKEQRLLGLAEQDYWLLFHTLGTRTLLQYNPGKPFSGCLPGMCHLIICYHQWFILITEVSKTGNENLNLAISLFGIWAWSEPNWSSSQMPLSKEKIVLLLSPLPPPPCPPS